jgi:thioredoxin 1
MLVSIDERSFTQEVYQASTPVLVHFWAPWCGLCRMITPMLSHFQQESGNRIKVVGINADGSLKLASTYRLTALPTLILFDGKQVLRRWEGLPDRDSLNSVLSEIVAQYGEPLSATRQS